MTRQIDDDAVINSVRLKEGSAPSTPAAGYRKLYVKTSGLFLIDDAGNEYQISPDVIGTAYQILRVNSGATGVEYASIGRVLISEESPTGATVTWNSIPSGYNSLHIELMGRTDKAAQANEGIHLYFNNDTTAANYYNQNLSGATTTASATAADDANVLTLPAATATANYAGMSWIEIPDYDGTTYHKIARLLNGRRETATTGFVGSRVMFWESTSAITRVDLVTYNSGNFVAGTKARLYGVY